MLELREVILLGDLVDTWTYAPSVTPPTMAEIIAANENVLGASGALANVVKAVPIGHLPARKPRRDAHAV